MYFLSVPEQLFPLELPHDTFIITFFITFLRLVYVQAHGCSCLPANYRDLYYLHCWFFDLSGGHFRACQQTRRSILFTMRLL